MKRRLQRRARNTSVRIIGGSWRGRRLAVPPGTVVRPTPDRVRETLFNWLADRLAGARCLDLFAGSGALGFEALSRGAEAVWFVERDPVQVQALEEHARLLGAPATIIAESVEDFLTSVPPETFDIVFFDPPYDMVVGPVLELLPPWLGPGALIYLERPRQEGLGAGLQIGTLWRESRAGQVSYGVIVAQ